MSVGFLRPVATPPKPFNPTRDVELTKVLHQAAARRARIVLNAKHRTR